MKLPIGIQTFSKLRKGNYLYVDKTREIHRMISSGDVFFLSRPRRFGKSLLISTLEAIFKGEKALFEGLYIADKVDWNERYPVIKLDWSSLKHTSAEEMERGTAIYLNQKAAAYGITLEQKQASNRFGELIQRLHEKAGRQVVVLVDEYDMPILDALNGPAEVIDEIRKFLQSFYKVLKAADEHLRFVFLTGVSKFSKVSIFSGLNNLNDITLDAEYAALCGYTQDELEQCFDSEIDGMAAAQQLSRQELLDRIRHWYNGFSWDGSTAVITLFQPCFCLAKKYSGTIGLKPGRRRFWSILSKSATM
jgi:hypothetical protein